MAAKPTYEELKRKIGELELEVERHKAVERTLDQQAQILSSLKDTIVIITPEMKTIYANKTAKDLFGDRPEMFTEPCHRFFKNRDTVCENCPVLKTIQDEKPHKALMRSYDKNGQEMWHFNTAFPFYDRDGQVIAGIEMVSDYTAQKRTELALEKSEERFRFAAEVAADLIYEWDIINDTLSWFGDIDRVLGYAPNEFPRTIEAWVGCIHPDDQSMLRDAVNHHREFTDSIIYEYRIQRKDGTWLYWTDRAVPVMDDNGRPRKWIGVCIDRTDQKQFEEELRESEEKFRLISEQSLMAIVIVQDDRIKYANQAYLAMTGYTWKEIMNWTAGDTSQLIHPDDRHFVMEQGRKKAAGIRDGVVTRYSYRGVTKSGEVRWIDQYSKTITYRGKPADLMTFIDIHDRKHAQETLSQSEKKYRELTDSLPQVVFETDEKGNITFANRIAFDLFDYTRADLEKGLNALQMVIPEDRERAIANIQKALRGEKFGGTEYTALTKDGRTYPVMLYSKPIMREGKSIGLRGIIADLTEVRGAEEALRESQEKFRNILESMEEGYYEVDLAGNFTFLNDALCRIRGYTRDELIGMNNRKYMDPKTAKEVFNVYNEVYTTGRPIKGLPWKIIRRDGTESYAEISASLIKDSQGKAIGFRGIVRDVTEKKQAEEALKASQQRLSQIIDFLPDATMVIDLEGKVIAWNRAIEEMTGVKKEDILGKGDYEYAIPFYGERRPVLIDLVGKWDKKIEKKYRYVKKEGKSLVSETYNPMVKPEGFLWNKASLLYDRDGNEIGAIESIRDITDMKVAEQTLRKSEERYRILVEESPLAISLIGKEGRYQYVNPKFTEMFGYNLEDIPTGRQWFRKAYPDQEYRREVISSWINDQKEARVGETRPRTFPVRCKDGSEKTINFKPVTLETGEQFVICEDITEEKRVEHALRMERDRSQMYLDVAGVMFIALDARGNVTLVNQKGCEILGYDEEEIVGQSWFNHFLPKEQGEEVKGVFQQLMGGVIEPVEYFENPIITRDGNLRYIAWHNALLKDEKGESIGTFSSGEDITERRRAEEERERLEAQLRQSQKMEAIGTLAGGIAHDFNNILGAIIGYSELAKMKLPEESDVIETLDQVIRAGKRAANLVKQILTVSRQHQQEKRPLQIGYIVEEALSLLRSTLPKTIEIKENLHKGTGIVNADPNQMHQVIMNLCTNAAHAMREDGGILVVELANVELNELEAAGHLDMDAGSYLRLTVSDTGCGMRPEIVKRIFDPYFTTKDVGEGTGLGLSVAQGIVKAHGGTITVFSEPRKGTTFHVYLPVISDAEKGKKKPKDLLVPTGTERILFIDDEQVLADIGGQMLERLGYGVVTKSDSLEALELFQREPNRFDLVITDMTMPHMTGDKLAQELIRIRPDIPIILCTGHSTQISEEKAKEIGIQILLMKPITNQVIAETVRKVLDKK